MRELTESSGVPNDEKKNSGGGADNDGSPHECDVAFCILGKDGREGVMEGEAEECGRERADGLGPGARRLQQERGIGGEGAGGDKDHIASEEGDGADAVDGFGSVDTAGGNKSGKGDCEARASEAGRKMEPREESREG